MFLATMAMRAFCIVVIAGCARLGMAILQHHVFKKGH